MTIRRTARLGCLAFALTVSVANADQLLQLSTKHLVAKGPTVTVTHDHDVKRIERPGAFDPSLFLLDLNSTLRIVRKRDQVEIFRKDVMPFTALTSVDGGRYFAGLSSLRTLSSEYNFMLISESGRIVTTARITPNSGHCQSVQWTTTNYIGWFDEKAPDVRLSFAGGEVDTVIVINPFDRAADGAAGKCVIRVTSPAASRR